MQLKKPQSVKLPVLLGVPVILGLAVAAVFLWPNDPAPRPQPPEPNMPGNDPVAGDDGGDPLDPGPDPLPRPKPRPGSPTELAVAEAMEAEAWKMLGEVRSRLELKYKGAEYQLDRTWTLEQVMRRLDKLTGTYFNPSDFELLFPEGDQQLALISCVSIQGQPLPDGPLHMTVDMATGKTEQQGRILARNTDGYVLVGDAEYEQISTALRDAAFNHIQAMAEQSEGAAEPTALLPPRNESGFLEGDFTAMVLKKPPKAVEFACRKFRGEPLAQPAVLTVDYGARTVALSRVDAVTWMEPPKSRDDFVRSLRWLLRDIAENALNDSAEDPNNNAPRAESLSLETWSWRYSRLFPFDVQISVESDTRVVVEVATSWGRPLSFAKVRYIADSATGSWGFED